MRRLLPVLSLTLALAGLGACASFGGACSVNAGIPLSQQDVGLAKGTLAPEIHAVDGQGHAWTLSEARAGGPIALVFYRGHWCPYCMKQLKELNEVAVPAARAAKVPLVVLSVDSPEESETTRVKFGFQFQMLSIGVDALQAYNIVHTVDMKAHPVIAHPGVFVVGADGKLTYAFADKDFRNRAPATDVVVAIEALKH